MNKENNEKNEKKLNLRLLITIILMISIPLGFLLYNNISQNNQPGNCVLDDDIMPFSNEPGVISKPVIYLYPEQQQNVKVNLDYDGELYITYPQYNNSIKGWDVTAYPDGKIINNEDNLEYSYIFWDGYYDKLSPSFDKGFIVEGKNSRVFLQEVLSKMGLTPKEYNEFIVYWLPLMEQNEYNVIKFLDKEYTDIAKLSISPTPDSILRVFMVYKGINSSEATKLKQTIKEQEIKPFERKGFSVIEWGGSAIS